MVKTANEVLDDFGCRVHPLRRLALLHAEYHHN